MVNKLILWVLLVTGNTLLSQIDTLEAVEIIEEKSSHKYDTRGGQLGTIITENEFKKAACCTLSESFELSNTVEVSNKDGISGIRQIEMLGLSGKYVLMTRNNMPLLNGIAQLNGFSNIPGPFVSNVYIAKGNGSATLGFEGLTGGIDYELKASSKEPRIFLNAYQNNQGRTEGNLLLKHELNKNFRNFTYLHQGKQWSTTDRNQDGFADMPMTDRVYVGNQSHFQTKNTEGMVGVSYWNDHKRGGNTDLIGGNKLSELRNAFRFNSNEDRLDIFAKLGVIPTEGETTYGNILNISNHRMNYQLNNLNQRYYIAEEMRIHYSGLVQTELSETWGLKSGISMLYTQLQEKFQSSSDLSSFRYDGNFNEFQSGIFGEAVYARENFKWVTGARMDYHNFYGWIFTPRTHLKYDFDRNHTIFMQGGYGRRQAYVFSENVPLLINSRIVQGLSASGGDSPYGFRQERGWNYGISFLKKFMFLDFPSNISIDVFRNQFDYRIIADQESFGLLTFKGLSGKEAGFSESIHTEWTFIPIMRFEVRIAYRYVNNQIMLGDKMQIIPLLSKHRALTTLTYKTRNQWYFDLVGSLNGSKQVFSRDENNSSRINTPVYGLINTQIRKIWNGWDFYVGIENIGNFRQTDPIFFDNNNAYVDASYSWGPTNGRMVYFGFRLELK